MSKQVCLTFAQLHYPEHSSMPRSRLASARQEQPSLLVDGIAVTDMIFSAVFTVGLLTQQPFSSTVGLGHTEALRYWRPFRALALETESLKDSHSHCRAALRSILALQVFWDSSHTSFSSSQKFFFLVVLIF